MLRKKLGWKQPELVEDTILSQVTLNLSLAAEENEDETNTNTEETQEHLIGFSVIDMENPYFITLESAAKAELEKAGYRMITKNPETDSKLQVTQIQEMIDEGIEAIILSPVDWEKITGA